MRQHAPGNAAPYQVAHGVEDLAQIMSALAGVFGQQGQVRRDEGPFVIADIGRVGGREECMLDIATSYHPATSSPQQALVSIIQLAGTLACIQTHL